MSVLPAKAHDNAPLSMYLALLLPSGANRSQRSRRADASWPRQLHLGVRDDLVDRARSASSQALGNISAAKLLQAPFGTKNGNTQLSQFFLT